MVIGIGLSCILVSNTFSLAAIEWVVLTDMECSGGLDTSCILGMFWL